MKLVYIAGAGHSGSTLLAFLLNACPGIFSIGEMHAPPTKRKNPEDRLCSCGVRLGECEFFAEMASRLRTRGIPFDPIRWDLTYSIPDRPRLSRLTFGSLRNCQLEWLRDALVHQVPAYRAVRKRIDEANLAFIREALDISGSSIFVDANKDPLRIQYLRKLSGVDLRVIHLVRDPRAHAFSNLRNRKIPPRLSAARWRRTNENVERHLASLHDVSHLLLQYERLCSDLPGSMKLLGHFISGSPYDVPENFRAVPHHIMGNRMRYSGESKVLLDTRWKVEFSPDDANLVFDVAGDLASHYGYESH